MPSRVSVSVSTDKLLVFATSYSLIATSAYTDTRRPQEEVRKRAHYEIINDGVEDIDSQIERLLTELNQASK